MEMNVIGQSQENNITPRTNVTRSVVDFLAQEMEMVDCDSHRLSIR